MAGVRQLLSRSAAIFLARIVGALLILLTQALISNIWGLGVLGRYMTAISAIGLLAAVMPLGFQNLANLVTTECQVRGTPAALRAFVIKTYLCIVVSTLLCALIARFGAKLGADISEAARDIAYPSVLFAAAIACGIVNGGVLLGMRRFLEAFAMDVLLRPAAILAAFALVGIAAKSSSPLTLALWGAGLTYSAAVALQTRRMWRMIGSIAISAGTPSPARGQFWRLALPLTLTSIATDFFFEIDILLLSPVLSAQELAVFGVCLRMFALIAFGVGIVYANASPDVLAADARRDEEAVGLKIGEANTIALLFSLFAASAAFGADPILSLIFGHSFSDAIAPLCILCLGLAVRSVFGPGSMILILRKRPYAGLPAVSAGLIALVAGNMLLVPAMRLNGAALAAVLAIAVWSLAAWHAARREENLDVSIFPLIKAMMSRP